MVDNNIFNILTPETALVQTGGKWIMIVFIALLLAIFLGWILFILFNRFRFKTKVYVWEKIGNTEHLVVDSARQLNIKERKMLYYRKLKKFSPVFDSKYYRIEKSTSFFGLLPKAVKTVTVYKDGDKMVPCLIHGKGKIEPIDYDAWNYLLDMLSIIEAKYEKNQAFMRILPFLALGGVILAFIVGSILWGQHVEKVALEILNAASRAAEGVLTKSGAVQVLT